MPEKTIKIKLPETGTGVIYEGEDLLPGGVYVVGEKFGNYLIERGKATLAGVAEKKSKEPEK
jgi:hypothetical protein